MKCRSRQKDVTFASRSKRHIRGLRLNTAGHHGALLRELYARLPEDAHSQRCAEELAAPGCDSTMHIVRLPYAGRDWHMAGQGTSIFPGAPSSGAGSRATRTPCARSSKRPAGSLLCHGRHAARRARAGRHTNATPLRTPVNTCRAPVMGGPRCAAARRHGHLPFRLRRCCQAVAGSGISLRMGRFTQFFRVRHVLTVGGLCILQATGARGGRFQPASFFGLGQGGGDFLAQVHRLRRAVFLDTSVAGRRRGA